MPTHLQNHNPIMEILWGKMNQCGFWKYISYRNKPSAHVIAWCFFSSNEYIQVNGDRALNLTVYLFIYYTTRPTCNSSTRSCLKSVDWEFLFYYHRVTEASFPPFRQSNIPTSIFPPYIQDSQMTTNPANQKNPLIVFLRPIINLTSDVTLSL
jgi:hypothetical protein